MSKVYKSRITAEKAAAKRSLFASLNGKFSQFDVIEKAGELLVVESGVYPARPFSIVKQYSGGYSVGRFD